MRRAIIAIAEAAYDRGDYATALRLWRSLAEQGDAAARFNLGFMYGKGRGVMQDYAEAARWYRLAADEGDARAQVNLGIMYADGRGVPQSYAEAVRWYRLAADQGDGSGQLRLGVMYAEGQDVPQDYVQAYMWSNLAAARFGPGTNRNMAITNRDLVAARMTPAQIAEAQLLAREWDAAHPRAQR